MAPKLGQMLVANQVLSEAELDRALRAQRMYGGKIGTNLIDLGLITDAALVSFLSRQLKMPAARAEDFESIPRDVLALVSAEDAARHKVIPLRMDRKLWMAISDPVDLALIDGLAFSTGKPVAPVVAPEIWIMAALERYYGVARPMRFMPMKDVETEFHGEILHEVASREDLEPRARPDAAPKDVDLAALAGRLLRASTKEQVFEALLDFASAAYARLAVFVVRLDAVTGWMVRGFPVRDDEFAALSLSRSDTTLFTPVLSTQSPYSGPIAPGRENGIFFSPLNLKADQRVDVFPVLYRGKVLALLLAADRRGSMPPGIAGRVEQGCAKVGAAMEILALRREISKTE